jgi:hypothetical protein
MPKQWWRVYENNEEQRFFTGKDGFSGLIRGKDKNTGKAFTWRSLKALSEEAGLTEKRTEEILHKYLKAGIVVRHEGGDKYAYWEKVDTEDLPGEIEKDQKDRMDKASRK